MTRQRLREGSIKWETILSMESFALKIVKKIEMLAFTDKIKSINTYVPEKIKVYIENTLQKEIDYFQKKYSYKIQFTTGKDLIIPEYKIELLNKNKKVVNVVENIDKIKNIRKNTGKTKDISNIDSKVTQVKTKSSKKISPTSKDAKESLKDAKDKLKKKKKKIKTLRTLWVRRKKAS